MNPLDCSHDRYVEIRSGGCFDALQGDTREPRKWCSICGALEVTDALDRSFRAWLFPILYSGELSS